jgi:hypothetical protein
MVSGIADVEMSVIALASCLAELERYNGQDWQPTFVVHDSWTDSPRGFCIVYEYDKFDGVLGFRATVPDWAGAFGNGRADDPIGFGRDLAFLEIAEPLGTTVRHLRADRHNVQWRGDLGPALPCRPA